MNNHNQLLNSIFFPRPTFKTKDEKDHLVEVEKDIYVSVRFFKRYFLPYYTIFSW